MEKSDKDGAFNPTQLKSRGEEIGWKPLTWHPLCGCYARPGLFIGICVCTACLEEALEGVFQDVGVTINQSVINQTNRF